MKQKMSKWVITPSLSLFNFLSIQVFSTIQCLVVKVLKHQSKELSQCKDLVWRLRVSNCPSNFTRILIYKNW